MSKRKEIDLSKNVSKLHELTIYARHTNIYVPESWWVDYETWEHDHEAYHDAIKPYWDWVVQEIEEHRYSDLLVLLKRLKGHLKAANKKFRSAERSLHEHELLYKILKEEATLRGGEVTLGDSFKEDQQSCRPDLWSWSQKSAGESVEITQRKFRLEIEQSYLLSFDCKKMPATFRVLSGDTTWREYVNLAASHGQSARKDLSDSRGLWEILMFRVDVIEKALWHYELTGDLPAYSQIGALELDFEDHLSFSIIQRGIELYDASPDDYKVRTALLTEVLEYFDFADVRRISERLWRCGLYIHHGRGRPTKHFESGYLVKMIEFWRHALAQYKKAQKTAG